ncbi:hypothetical protein NT6N_02600 [Oceaniferula spumae]|uniref:CAAX prenyl protease 2/Lysostaphin resistance protein A-like domain-containing protein n=1 Tax=Oceaniferula spumae TaxID=2979115 RepID=A0AAT9FGW4_9BACT
MLDTEPPRDENGARSDDARQFQRLEHSPGYLRYFRISRGKVAAVLAILWLFSQLGEYSRDPYVGPDDEASLLDYISVNLLVSEQAESHSAVERWLAGTESREDARKEAILYLEKAQEIKMLGEDGLSVLACLYLASDRGADCRKVMADLPEEKMTTTWILHRLLAGEELASDDWWYLQEVIAMSPRSWREMFLAEKAMSVTPDTEKHQALQDLIQKEKQNLLVANTKFSLSTLFVFLLGIVLAVQLTRKFSFAALTDISQRHLVAYTDVALAGRRFPKSWLLSTGIIMFVLADFAASTLYELLWQTTPINISTTDWWVRVFLYDTLYRVIGVALLVWVFFGRIGYAWRTFFTPVPRLMHWVLAALAVSWLFDMLIYWMPIEWFPIDPTQVLISDEYGWVGLAWGLCSAVILAPICEEIVYRGFLFNVLKNRCGLHLAVFLSSFVFAMVHFYGFQDLLGVFVFGVIMAYLYQRTNSLLPCVLCHACYNLVVTLWKWTMYQSPENLW